MLRKLLILSIVFAFPAFANGAASIDASTATNSNAWVVTGAGANAAPAWQLYPDISISSNGLNSGTFAFGGSLSNFNGFWYADLPFFLPANATNVSFSFSGLNADDRVVLQLNGTNIGNYFLNASPGNGVMSFPPGPHDVPFTFTNQTSGTITSGFLLGQNNDLRLVVNNTDSSDLNASTQTFTSSADGTVAGVNGSVTFSIPSAMWARPQSGDWNVASNWYGSIPDGVGLEADFFGVISSAQTVYTNVPVTVGTIHFNSANTYVLTGAGSLAIQAIIGTIASVQVDQGLQEINLPLTIASNTVFDIADGATLLIANPITIDAGVIVSQSGGGKVTYQSIITLQPGASLTLRNSTMANTLALQSGSTVHIAADTASELELYNLNLGPGATLDVASNMVSVDYLDTSPLTTLKGEVASAYDNGHWDGSGITSSSAASNPTHATALGIFDTGSQIQIKYSWMGDANLDGVVNSSDLALMSSLGTTWQKGDFNYDGKVNADDYALFMLGAVQSDGANISTTLPEPSVVWCFAVGLAGICRRRHS